MVALTRDFHVVAARVATRISAVLFSAWYIAQTRYVSALSGFLICHYDFVLSKSHPTSRTTTKPARLIACSSPNLPAAVNTMIFQDLCDHHTENMKRPWCQQKDSGVGISTPFTLASQYRALINHAAEKVGHLPDFGWRSASAPR
jgi:hypothetical protein